MGKYLATRNWFADIKRLFKSHKPKIAVDGGAHKGEYTKSILSLSPHTIVHAFEPIPGLCNVLNKRFGKRVIVHRNALGSENKKCSFNILKSKGASSVLDPSKFLVSLQGKKVAVEKKVEVDCCRLDSVIRGNVDFIKLDLQGYELEALKGCGEILKNVRVIFIEIEFIDLYDTQPLFSDVDLYLRENNFKLFNFYNLSESKQGQLSGGNALYLNRGFYD